MTIIQREVQIPAAPEAVYDYVTRPKRWKEWHPASQATLGIDAASLEKGERFSEQVRSAGFTRLLQWQVSEAEPGLRWQAEAWMRDGSRVFLLYEFLPAEGGTLFRRTLTYTIRPRLLRTLNDLLVWRRVARESEQALENLRRHFA